MRPSGEVFPCAADTPVLNGAHAANVLIAYSCRSGRCGTCRGRVLQGEISYPAGLPEALTENEIDAGYVLLCSAHPRSNLVIEWVGPDFNRSSQASA